MSYKTNALSRSVRLPNPMLRCFQKRLKIADKCDGNVNVSGGIPEGYSCKFRLRVCRE